LEQKKSLQAKAIDEAPKVRSFLVKADTPESNVSEELAAVNEKLYNLRLTVVRNLADLQLAVFFCFPNSTWSSQMVGVFGMINAVVGIYQTCRDNARKQ